MSQSQPSETVRLQDRLEKVASRRSACGFDISPLFRNRDGLCEAQDVQVFRKLLHGPLIFVGLCSPETVIEMSDRDVISEFPQYQHERRRIGTARHPNEHAVLWREHVMAANGLLNFLNEGMHGEIIARGMPADGLEPST